LSKSAFQLCRKAMPNHFVEWTCQNLRFCPGAHVKRVVKIQGEFVWHDHGDTDETFIVLEGNIRIDFRDGFVNLSQGEMYVVPKGIEHKPYAEHEAKVLLIEPRGVVKWLNGCGQPS
jgi:homogentisate 1,2-dioxygenase